MNRLVVLLVSFTIILGITSLANAQQIIIPDDSVWGFAWSPDSTQIAVGRYDGTVEILDADSKETVLTLETQVDSQIVPVVWSADGKIIAASNENADIFIWNAADGELLHRLKSFDDGNTLHLVFSPDSSRLAGIAVNSIQILDVRTEEMLVQNYGGAVGIDWVGNVIVSASSNGIGLIDSTSGKYINEIGWHTTAYITSVKLSPDGSRIASGSMDGTIRLGDVENVAAATIVSCHTILVSQVDWHPDGEKVVSAGYDGKICVLDSVTGELLSTIQEDAPILNVQWSPDGKQLAYSGDVEGLGGVIHILDTADLPSSLPTLSSTQS